MKVTRAVAHAKHSCGHVVTVPIDDLTSHVICAGCGEEAWLEERHIVAAREGYAAAIHEAGRQESAGEDGSVHLMVDVDASEARRVQ